MPVDFDENELSRRRWLLKKYRKQSYILKIHSSQVTDAVLSDLFELGYRPIRIERRNLLDQFLSYLIAQRSGIWSHQQRAFENNYLAAPIEINSLDNLLLAYELTCLSRRDLLAASGRGPIYYEDFCNLENKLEILSLMGFEDWPDYMSPTDKPVLHILENLHRKLLNEEEKLKLIQNREEVFQWGKEKLTFMSSPIVTADPKGEQSGLPTAHEIKSLPPLGG